MGMYDYVKSEYPLPVPEVQENTFQTKSMGRQLETYFIKADGSLWLCDWNEETESRELERPFFHTGELRFYNLLQESAGLPDSGWVELSCYFVKGKLESGPHLIEYEPVKGEAVR